MYTQPKIRSAAFRHRPTGQIFETGSLHDLNGVPADVNLDDLESGFVTHEGAFLPKDQLIQKSLKEYQFDDPVPDPAAPSQMLIVARHQAKPIGTLTFHTKPNTTPDHPHEGYHMIAGADVSALHRGNGIYGRMLQLGSTHVKKKLGGKGLVSPGQWRSEAASGAWEKLADKGKVRSAPGVEPEAPDFFMSEKETSFDNIQHEFEVEFKRWLAARTEGRPYEPHAAYNFGKAEEGLASLIGTSNLNNDVAEGHHEIARQMLGYNPQSSPEFIAARFLAGGELASDDAVRTALILYDNDFELAALRAYGLPRNESYREMLRATIALRSYLPEINKSDIDTAIIPRDIKAGDPEAEDTAESVRNAQASGGLNAVQLDPSAKHSKGTAIATDPKSTEKILLKPGSGKLSPSAGVRDETADQSQREVAFSKLVQVVGIGKYFPKAELLIVDGQRVAALELLGTEFIGLDKLRQKDDSFDPTKLFAPYITNGALYKWALVDWVFGNTDRHANNIMVNEDQSDLKLIDHGSAFAGAHFDPAHDSKSFVPFYLRAWAQDKNWAELNAEEREDEIPRMNAKDTEDFGKWIDSINEAEIAQIMQQYGIHPEASMARLQKIKAVAPELRADVLIGLWVGALS